MQFRTALTCSRVCTVSADSRLSDSFSRSPGGPRPRTERSEACIGEAIMRSCIRRLRTARVAWRSRPPWADTRLTPRTQTFGPAGSKRMQCIAVRNPAAQRGLLYTHHDENLTCIYLTCVIAKCVLCGRVPRGQTYGLRYVWILSRRHHRQGDRYVPSWAACHLCAMCSAARQTRLCAVAVRSWLWGRALGRARRALRGPRLIIYLWNPQRDGLPGGASLKKY